MASRWLLHGGVEEDVADCVGEQTNATGTHTVVVQRSWLTPPMNARPTAASAAAEKVRGAADETGGAPTEKVRGAADETGGAPTSPFTPVAMRSFSRNLLSSEKRPADAGADNIDAEENKEEEMPEKSNATGKAQATAKGKAKAKDKAKPKAKVKAEGEGSGETKRGQKGTFAGRRPPNCPMKRALFDELKAHYTQA